jgi:hypothetical protein
MDLFKLTPPTFHLLLRACPLLLKVSEKYHERGAFELKTRIKNTDSHDFVDKNLHFNVEKLTFLFVEELKIQFASGSYFSLIFF